MLSPYLRICPRTKFQSRLTTKLHSQVSCAERVEGAGFPNSSVKLDLRRVAGGRHNHATKDRRCYEGSRCGVSQDLFSCPLRVSEP